MGEQSNRTIAFLGRNIEGIINEEDKTIPEHSRDKIVVFFKGMKFDFFPCKGENTVRITVFNENDPETEGPFMDIFIDVNKPYPDRVKAY